MTAEGYCLVFTGSYGEATEDGIQVFRLDLANGALTKVGGASGVKNPSFLAVHPSGTFLYAVSEVGEFSGQPVGAVAAFLLDDAARPTLLNTQPSGGQGPCHVSLDRSGRNALVANYGSGHVAVLPIGDDGRLSPPSFVARHMRPGADPHAPHAHAIILDPTNRFALAADLGLDAVMLYRFEATGGRLFPNDPPAVAVPRGTGPRHIAFHPRGNSVYVSGEMASSVTTFSFDATAGVLSQLQTLSTLPDASEDNSTAEIAVSPDGRHVYVSNRGHDSLAVFAVDQSTGLLRAAGHCSSGGRTPRHFAIDPSGRWLLVANQDSGNLVVYRIDPSSGMPRPAGHEVSLPRPVCVRFLPR